MGNNNSDVPDEAMQLAGEFFTCAHKTACICPELVRIMHVYAEKQVIEAFANIGGAVPAIEHLTVKYELTIAKKALEEIVDAPNQSLWMDDRDDAAEAVIETARAALKKIKGQKNSATPNDGAAT